MVTGASRGVGRGIALQLGEAGATVYITGRQSGSLQLEEKDLPTLEKTAGEITERGGRGIAVFCDHSDKEQIRKLFERIEQETDGQLDVLVNNVFSAIRVVERAAGKAFWELEPETWDAVNDVGLRSNYYSSVYAARMMVKRHSGLIVNISSAGGLRYLFTVAYGVGKAAMDRMAADMAHELFGKGVTVISLWPGAVKTEVFEKMVKQGVFDASADKTTRSLKKMIETGETPEFVGKAVVALASDPSVSSKTGRTMIAADLGLDYQFRDIDGHQPESMRSLKTIFTHFGYPSIGAHFPTWLRIPGWLMVAANCRL